MATVEEIYRKIRRGDTADLKATRTNDAELAAGVERIRARLLSTVRQPTLNDSPVSQNNLDLAQTIRKRLAMPKGGLLWLFAPAAAAVIAFGFFFSPRLAPPAQTAVAAGTVWKYGSVEVRVVRDSFAEKKSDDGKFLIELRHGMLAVRRRDTSTALEVRTPAGKLVAEGTTFVIEQTETGATSVKLIEGKLSWHTGNNPAKILNAKNSSLGRDLTDYLPPDFRTADSRHLPKGGQKFTHCAGECVTYYRNNEKRRGKIYAREGSDYVIHGEGGPEPGVFRDGDFFRRACDE